MNRHIETLLHGVALATLLLIATQAPAAQTCARNSACVDTRSFSATVSDFRTSKQNNVRVLTATVQFQNKTSKPLMLGYVRDSGIAIDDQGNRFVVPQSNGVRGIGEITGNSFESKFTLQPGESSNARLEFIWGPGDSVIGTTYEMDLAIREIEATGPDQFRLGAEHSLHFNNVSEPGAAAAATTNDPCAGATGCYNAGPFVAEVQQLSASSMEGGARHQTLTLSIRFRNTGTQPIILAYKPGTSAAIDNLGNRYYYGRASTHDGSVKGIGYVQSGSADPQFALAPGQSRNAQFSVTRFEAARKQLGTSYSYDVVITELEVLPSQQLRTLREDSLSFPNLTAGTYAATTGGAAINGAPSGVTPNAASIETTATKVIDLFNKLKKH
ncbi:MAG: hypothetical protein IPG25_17475 [Proteobacteria bacterium]|nr:hypothetical protein [Pseudomonadota bacterium]